MISAAVTDEHDKTAVIAKPYRTVGNPGCEAAKDKFLNALCGHLRFSFPVSVIVVLAIIVLDPVSTIWDSALLHEYGQEAVVLPLLYLLELGSLAYPWSQPNELRVQTPLGWLLKPGAPANAHLLRRVHGFPESPNPALERARINECAEHHRPNAWIQMHSRPKLTLGFQSQARRKLADCPLPKKGIDTKSKLRMSVDTNSTA